MKKSRFCEALFMAILQQAEGGVSVPELCREHGMSSASFYKWRAKYGGMDASMISEMKALDDENMRLKKMYAELSMLNELLKEAFGKSVEVISAQGDGPARNRSSRCQHSAGLPDVLHQRDLLLLQAKAEC